MKPLSLLALTAALSLAFGAAGPGFRLPVGGARAITLALLRRVEEAGGQVRLGERAARIAWQAAEALARAHGAGLVHRDLKPGNILLTWAPSADTVVLTDFGTAQLLEVGTRLAGPGGPADTISCLAPEQLRDSDVGPPADMWALGAMLYTAVEGRPPFTGSTTAEVVAAIRTMPVPMPEYAGPLRDLLTPLVAALVADLRSRGQDPLGEHPERSRP